MRDETIVPYDSPEAARRELRFVWVSRTGALECDTADGEHRARFAGCTHMLCACGALVVRSMLRCGACEAKRRDAAIAAMPRAAYDGECLLYSHAKDEWFGDLHEAYDALGDGDTLESLLLELSDPWYLSEIDEDHWVDDLPDVDDPLPPKVGAALAALNAAIKAAGPVSWVRRGVMLDCATIPAPGAATGEG